VLFVVTGPSGCGKSTIIHRVLDALDGVRFSVSHTTRPPREGEVNGRDYYFISPAEFAKMIDREAFLEWAVVHGHQYGTSRKEVESKAAAADLILDVDVQGARRLRGLPVEAVFVFIVPPRFEDLKERLERRSQDDPRAIRRRLATAVQEVEAIPEFDGLIINDNMETAVDELESVVRAGRCRDRVRSGEAQAVLESFRKARLE
jgi:guanylate kinase